MCCEPLRSPRLAEIGEELALVRSAVDRAVEDPGVIDPTIESLEKIGRLQVGCCAPARMPLYDRVLRGLTTIQISLNRERGAAH